MKKGIIGIFRVMLFIIVFFVTSYAQQPKTDISQEAALMVAVEKGRADRVNALIAADADVNVQNKHGHTALMVAARNNHVDIIKRLLV